MSTRLVPGAHSIKLQRDGLGVQHRHQPAYRTYEALARLAPVHALGPVNGSDLFGQGLGENLARGASALGDFRYQVLALLSCAALHLGNFDTSLFRERMGGSGRLPVLEGDTHRRTG